ncbi:MAG TPA: STAS domain-containing protein [Pseudonocardia sp.]|jgi:anti-anti-sigma factor|uniref:STAS domain-containing protein n=1 Tax=Pseudonocardia sp. TaxID=60912 RepID=UPI002B4B462B|nr:STAS domain-containing protein [Pseudonocardia sp.]HLU59435.1 STAS domain-containing protein [Pseudonocardia sp.]
MSQRTERIEGEGGCLRPPAGLLRIEVAESRPGVTVLAPVGEVDVSTADVLRHAADEAVAAAPRCLVIDLSRLTFCGSTGLVVLMGAQQAAEAAGVRFGTAGGPPIVRRVLEITQLGPVLQHRESVDAALQELDA